MAICFCTPKIHHQSPKNPCISPNLSPYKPYGYFENPHPDRFFDVFPSPTKKTATETISHLRSKLCVIYDAYDAEPGPWLLLDKMIPEY